MNEKFTKGPWFADKDGRIWRRPPEDLYENGGGVAGDRAIAVTFYGWYGVDQEGYPLKENAALISSAPEMFFLLEMASCPNCDGSGAYHGEQGEPLPCQWCDERSSVIAKARGESWTQ